MYSFTTLLDSFETNTSEEVLESYASVVRPKIKKLFPENPKDKTTIINGTIFVSKDQKAVKGYSTVFKKVLNKFRDYGKLENIDYDFKSQLFESFLKESISKKNWGQFFTPLKVVRSIADMAKDEIKEGAVICDPACGVGKFLLEPIKTKLDLFFEIKKGSIIPKIALHGFDKGFDRDEQKTIILAKANMLIYFSDLIKENPGLTEQFAELFNNTFLLKTNSILGTLSEPVESVYDLILTNPPYVTSGSSNLKEEIKKDGQLVNHYKINALGVEGLFMEWIVRALKPGGRAYVVIPDGILNRQHDNLLRRYILDECTIEAVISLPVNTFFTTNKKTYILSVTKKISKKTPQIDPIFCYLVSEIGESRDIYRFDIDHDDLKEAVTLYSFFKHNKAHFGKVASDPRCKIVDFSFFKQNVDTGWVTDNLWTESERIELGILKVNKTMSIPEFAQYIGDISTSLVELQTELVELEAKKKSNLIFSTFRIDDLFDSYLGNPNYTRRYGENNKGEYPVYGASNNAPLTSIKTYDYNGKYLTWARNGFAGFIKSHNGKFNINYDRGILVPKHGHIDVDYVKVVLEPFLRKTAVGRRDHEGKDEFTKLYLSTMREQEVPVPVDEDGSPSLDAQREIVEQAKFIFDLKKQLETFETEISNSSVIVSNNSIPFQEGKIVDFFDVIKGIPKYTNSYILANPGPYPVFSSQTTDEGVMGRIATFDFDKECITWTTDGVHAGTVFLRNEKFSMTTHCGALVLKDAFVGKISYSYVASVLRNELKKVAVGEQNKRVTVTTIARLPIRFPMDGDKLDLLYQNSIAEKQEKIDRIRNELILRIRSLKKLSPISNSFD
jgi:type I restriction-modification system DNA methylase subunit/restriction endonuclease S subunit